MGRGVVQNMEWGEGQGMGQREGITQDARGAMTDARSTQGAEVNVTDDRYAKADMVCV